MKLKLTVLLLLLLAVFSKAYAQPEAQFSFTVNNCFQASFTESSTCAGCTLVSWQWDFGDGVTSTQQNPTHTFTTAGSYQVSLLVTDANANWDTLQAVVAISCLDVVITSNNVPDCFFSECATLQAFVTGGTPPYTYDWGNGVPGPGIMQACTTGTYTVIVTDAAGQQGIASVSVWGQHSIDISVDHEGCGSSDGAIDVDVYDGLDEIEYLWSPGGQTTSSLTGLSAGTYTLTVNDTAGCTETFSIVVLDSCGFIAGNVFWDLNNNTTLDNGEEPFTMGNIQSTGGTVYETQVNADGSFTMVVGAGNYTTNFVPHLGYYSVSPQNHLSQINNSSDSVDFAVSPISGNPDLQLFLFPVTPARPGFDARYHLVAKNVGTDTLSGSVRLSIDPRLSVVSSLPAYDTYVNDSMTWTFTDFAPLTILLYDVVLHIPAPTAVNIGDILSFSGIIYPVTGDMAPLDNYTELRQTVIGSFDPNDKWVSLDTISPALITSGEYLSYRIRFQNTGTDTAFTIAVRDTLDANLDWGTLETLYASHSYALSIRGGNALEWRFENILLPDSNTNEPMSHGYVYYRIKPKSSLVLGDGIYNTASIYFDFNPPVVTNTTYSEVAKPSSVSEHVLAGQLSIFPNPNSGEFTLQYLSPASGNYSVDVLDISGRVIYSQSLTHKTKTEFRPSLKLSGGIYLVRISGEEGSSSVKVVVR